MKKVTKLVLLPLLHNVIGSKSEFLGIWIRDKENMSEQNTIIIKPCIWETVLSLEKIFVQ